MIFGDVPSFVRFPFQRPAGARASFRPSVLDTSYRSGNFHPFQQVLPTMATYSARLPSMPAGLGPGPAPQYQEPPVPGPMQGAASMMRGQRAPNPTRIMRGGFFPAVAGNASNVRNRVLHAGAMMRSLSGRGG